MKLVNAWVVNHKSLKNIHVPFSDDSYITLIGLNDAGKSTLLKSLELFFKETAILPQGTETSKISAVSNSPLEKGLFESIFTELELPVPDYNAGAVYILTEFRLEHVLTIEEIDSLKPSEHLQLVLSGKNIGDSIFLLKVLGAGGDYFIFCEDATDEEGKDLRLWSQTQAALKSLQAKCGIKDTQVQNQNQSGGLKNVERATAIYATMTLEKTWARYDFKKDRGLFPLFEYLDWNISIDQLYNLVTAAVGPAIEQSLKDVQVIVNERQEDVNKVANQKLGELYEKYSSHLPASVTGLSANINIPLAKNTTELFVSKSTSDQHIHIGDQGDGIKRQIGLGLIRAIAEDNTDEADGGTKYIWVLDEPETHLYPQAQRELAESLRQLSSNKFQIVVSTHSITFVDKTRLEDVYKVELEDGYTRLLSTEDNEGALATLGVKNSDFLFYDKFLAVEGATEYHLLDHFHLIIYGTSLSDAGVRGISLGGESNRAHYKKILEDILGDYRKTDDSIIYLLDKDTGVRGSGIYLVGETADFEDSITNEIWIELLKNECGVDVSAEDLQGMRSGINLSNKKTKLHEQLKVHVATNASRSNYLNSKGEALANDIKKYISDASQIPQPFKDAFSTFH